MCQQEVYGNLHQGCGCFDVIYPGNKLDCGQPNCGTSSAHAHRAYCRCPKQPQESRRIINLFRPMCDRHKAAQWEAAVGRRGSR
ncbi:hypothetical protein B0H16DRAFT_1511446 [Mycena metata]|uniref:Uncharacterized protein n=1 Tax=Mycena metata TaxID=1033252 RepID=A0AAD7NSV6_9AGAR|nr:hypothetical protein B0H16DRAFT_1511446 [Mycena metata]